MVLRGLCCTRSVIMVVMRWDLVVPSTLVASAGRAAGSSTPAEMASSMSWFKKAIWSARRTVRPSMVRAQVPLVWVTMPLRTSQDRLRPSPSFSRKSTTRRLCW